MGAAERWPDTSKDTPSYEKYAAENVWSVLKKKCPL
jgi:hypothetical protein